MIVRDPPAYVLFARQVAQLATARPFLPSFEVWARDEQIALLKGRLRRLQSEG